MKSNQLISKLKSYHIIIFGCILGIILVLNSNSVNQKKLKEKETKEQIAFFNKIISQRKLQQLNPGTSQEEDEDEEVIVTDEVCSYASDELKEYYKTSDLSKIDLDDGSIKCEDKDEDYMQALIAIVQKLVEGDENDNNESDPITGTRRNLRNLIDKDTEENIKIYGKRILYVLVFAIFSILSFLGWIICCFCNCCNCCCCCCCKKSGCKIPFFIFTYLFYALVVVVCIYGLTQTNKIFTGLSNTECSFLKFFDEIIYGEEKEERPKWVGIEGVSHILDNLHNEITDMKDSDLEGELNSNMNEIGLEKNNFLQSLKTAHLDFYKDTNANTPKDGYCIEYTSTDGRKVKIEGTDKDLIGRYCIDVIDLFGKYDESKSTEEEKFTGVNRAWYTEISGVESETAQSLNDVRESFHQILVEKLEDIKGGVNQGIDKLEKLRKPFDNVYNEISDAIYDFSEIANNQGESIIKLVFGALAGLNVALAILLLLICLFSGTSCVSCCCCRCICKLFTHLIWNILAILMIVSFLLGSVLACLGRVGGDLMSFVSYVLSQENFDKEDDAVLLGKLGQGREILEKCIVGDGDLSTTFDLSSITEHFDTIREKKNDIQRFKQDFNNLAQNYPAYNEFLKPLLEKKINFNEDTNFKNIDAETNSEAMPYFSLFNIINSLNDAIDTLSTTNSEKYNGQTGDKNFICTEGNGGSGPTASPNNNLLHPWTCEPIYRGWIKSSNDADLKNYANIATDAITILKYASNEKIPDDESYKSYYDILLDLKSDYTEYLNTYINVLNFFDDITGSIISIIEDGIGDSESTFSFLNGKFIKTDLKIVLKYLKYSLGKDIYTVGLCLVIIGFSLILSISSTILLLVIINIDLENNKKLAQDTEIPNYPVTNDGRVIQFKYD